MILFCLCNRVHKGGFRQSEKYIRSLTVWCYHSLLCKYWLCVYLYACIFVNCVEGFCELPYHMVQAQCEQQDMESDYLAFEFTKVDFCDSLVMIEIQWSNTGWTLEFVEEEPYRFLLILYDLAVRTLHLQLSYRAAWKTQSHLEVLCRCSGSVSAESSLLVVPV